jgi:hypothetical protein
MIIDFIRDGSTVLNGSVSVLKEDASAISSTLDVDLVPGISFIKTRHFNPGLSNYGYNSYNKRPNSPIS